MTKIIKNELTKQQEVVFKRDVWLGTMSLTVDGVKADRVKRMQFQYADKDGNLQNVYVKGSEFTSMTLEFNGGGVLIVRKLEIYEYILSLLPILGFGFIGVNPKDPNHVLKSALVGGLSAFFFMINLMLARKIKHTYLKILVLILLSILAIGLAYYIKVETYR